jgi:hypothetical protein
VPGHHQYKINHAARTLPDMDDPPIPVRSIERALADLIETAERLGPDDRRAPRLAKMISGLREFMALSTRD